jgi:hypothetical protein
MIGKIDWAALAAEELEQDHQREATTRGGIIVPNFAGVDLASWVKFAGEPAFVLVETPAQFATRWMAFRDNSEQDVCVFHERTFGQAVFFFRESLRGLMYVQVTFPTSAAPRTTPGSIWAGQCKCWKYGGPCPQPA